MMQAREIPLEQIWWEDASSSGEGWANLNELLERVGVAVICSVGFVIKETDKEVTIVQSLGTGDNSMVGHDMSIPKNCIMNRQVLYVKEKL